MGSREKLDEAFEDEKNLLDGEQILRLKSLLELGQILRQLSLGTAQLSQGDFHRMNRSDGIDQVVSFVHDHHLNRWSSVGERGLSFFKMRRPKENGKKRERDGEVVFNMVKTQACALKQMRKKKKHERKQRQARNHILTIPGTQPHTNKHSNKHTQPHTHSHKLMNTPDPSDRCRRLPWCSYEEADCKG